MSQIYEQMALDGLVDLKMTKAAELPPTNGAILIFLEGLLSLNSNIGWKKTSLWPIKWLNSLT